MSWQATRKLHLYLTQIPTKCWWSPSSKDAELDKKSSWLLEEGETGEGEKPRASSEHSWAGKHKRINGQQPAGRKAFRYSGFSLEGGKLTKRIPEAFAFLCQIQSNLFNECCLLLSLVKLQTFRVARNWQIFPDFSHLSVDSSPPANVDVKVSKSPVSKVIQRLIHNADSAVKSLLKILKGQQEGKLP